MLEPWNPKEYDSLPQHADLALPVPMYGLGDPKVDLATMWA